MLKKFSLAAVLTLSVVSAASADTSLIEWNDFAFETATPVVASNRAIDWNAPQLGETTYQLAEFNGFGVETKTPSKASADMDWDNLSLRVSQRSYLDASLIQFDTFSSTHFQA